MLGFFGAFWGLTGVCLLLGSAIYRLSLWAFGLSAYPMLWYHWLALAVSVLGMAYMEGFRGFQQGFSPRVAARALYLKENPNLLHALLGPLFCMGFFYATRRRRITSISLTVGIIILIILVRMLSQPWRGIVDAGVVIGLAWGLVTILIFSVMAFTSREFPYSPETPEEIKR